MHVYICAKLVQCLRVYFQTEIGLFKIFCFLTLTFMEVDVFLWSAAQCFGI